MCPVCQARQATIGVLCSRCSEEISKRIRATPEQVQLQGSDDAETEAALVDPWGRVHPLSPTTPVGRLIEGDGLAVLEASISRNHARITLEGETWWVHDLGSANGTYVDDQRVESAVELRPRAKVRFGQMAFYFLPDGVSLSPPDTVQVPTVLLPRAGSVSGEQTADADLEAPAEGGDGALPVISLKLHEPTGGGSGFMELDGKRIQLTATQLELISIMMRRMTADADSPPLVRGFVRSSELIAALSWDTPEPNENHVKQLVRRVRRALMKAALGDLIESRHRFGYRLRAIPRTD